MTARFPGRRGLMLAVGAAALYLYVYVAVSNVVTVGFLSGQVGYVVEAAVAAGIMLATGAAALRSSGTNRRPV